MGGHKVERSDLSFTKSLGQECRSLGAPACRRLNNANDTTMTKTDCKKIGANFTCTDRPCKSQRHSSQHLAPHHASLPDLPSCCRNPACSCSVIAVSAASGMPSAACARFRKLSVRCVHQPMKMTNQRMSASVLHRQGTAAFRTIGSANPLAATSSDDSSGTGQDPDPLHAAPAAGHVRARPSAA